MRLIIYGDFNCPYSLLASMRADRLAQAGQARIEWRAVEHDRSLPLSGSPAAPGDPAWARELAEVAALTRPGEVPPAAPPPLISNTGAAVSAYAEAITDGIEDDVRRRLFAAIWADGQHISSAPVVRSLIVPLLWPADALAPNLGSPDLPRALNRMTSLTGIVRRSGGTIAPDGGPLTDSGHARIRAWREGWQAAAHGVVPAVIGADGDIHPGIAGLEYLAGLTASGPAGEREPALAAA